MNKNNRGISLVATVLAIFIVAAIGLVGIQIYNHATTTGSPQSASEVFVKIKQKATAYPGVEANSNKWVAQMGSGASLTKPGYDYAVSTQNFASVYFGLNDKYNSQTAYPKFPVMVTSAIKQVMGDAGYSKSGKTYSIAGAYNDFTKTTSTPEYVVYTKGDSTCLQIYDSNQAVVTFSCFTPADLTHAFLQANPYVNGYTKSNSSSQLQSLTFGPVTVKSQVKTGVIGPSKSAGYNISEVVLTQDGTKKLALFYNHNGGPWLYITKAGDEFGFSCDAYAANPEVSKAMYGQVCLSQNGQIHFGTDTTAL